MSNSPINNNSGTSSSIEALMNNIDLGPHNSIQFLFAKLQLAQAQICKDQANDYIEKIQKTQEEQRECAKMIEEARKLQNEAENGKKNTEMPQEMREYFTKHDLDWDTDGDDYVHDKDEWEFNIKSLTNYQETLGTSSQTDMVFLQDFMGQYNSFLQGANSAIQDSNDTLTTILRG